jgi:hypothetical protein
MLGGGKNIISEILVVIDCSFKVFSLGLLFIFEFFVVVLCLIEFHCNNILC